MYKELLAKNPKLAMLFDLSERFPRGPQANLRAHHYEGSHGGYYQRHETQLNANEIRGDKKTAGVYETCTVEKHGFCPVAYGYDVLKLHAWFQKNRIYDGGDFKRAIERLMDVTYEGERSEGEQWVLTRFMGWSKQATRTRRSNRIGLRIRQLKKWVEDNVTTAYYRVGLGYATGDLYVHADSEAAAQSQYELFLKPAVAAVEKSECNPRYRDGREFGNHGVRYSRHALEGPVGLMQMNKDYSAKANEKIAAARENIARLEEQIAALEMAQQMVESYSANMTCSYDYEETV
tara:strand:- start:4128 stop:5000 length:873 start_codon:yes stop_codon:yes gene_type:complete